MFNPFLFQEDFMHLSVLEASYLLSLVESQIGGHKVFYCTLIGAFIDAQNRKLLNLPQNLFINFKKIVKKQI